MPKRIRELVDCDPEIMRIDEEIGFHRREIETLKIQRYERMSKVQNDDMDVVIECIIENGLSSEEMMQLIAAEAKKKALLTCKNCADKKSDLPESESPIDSKCFLYRPTLARRMQN